MNCRGVGKKGFALHLHDLIKEYSFDFIGLQETMKRNIDASVWRKFDVDGVYIWLWSPSMGCSGGIFCGIKSSRFNVLNLSIGRYFVKAKVHDKKNQKDHWLIIVYGAAQTADKDIFLQDLTNICDNLDLPALVGGDFNILRFADEKK
jgi:hypothetical protein